MNKHVRSLTLSLLAVALTLLLMTVPGKVSANAAPIGGSTPNDPNYAVVKLKFERQAPKFSTVDCPDGENKDCVSFTGGIGVYKYVSLSEPIATNNIQDLTVTDVATRDTTSPGTPAPEVSNVRYIVVKNDLRIYGLTVGHTYTLSFNFVDRASADITKLLSNTAAECKNIQENYPTGEFTVTKDKNAQFIAYKVVEPDDGCNMYNSEDVTVADNGSAFQFLPSSVQMIVNNGGDGYKFTRAGKQIAAADITNAAAQQQRDEAGAKEGQASSSLCGYEDGKAVNWIVCPLTSILQGAASKLSDQLVNLLYFPTDRIFANDGSAANDGMHKAWTSFRNIALALILIAGLIMVISQAAGLEILDAYTIRKLMPRLAIALIGIALSWPLMNFVIGFFNDIGTWTFSAILTPFQNMPIADQQGNGRFVLEWLVLILAAPSFIVYMYALGVMGALALLFTIVAALFIGLLVLAIRWAIIAMTLLLAPLAIAAYVLPGTQKLWSFWKNTLITTLMMFPIVMGLIAAGNVMARVATAIGADNYFFILIMYFAPFFMLPFAFKLAGGLMTTIFSLANDKSRGIFDRARNLRSNSMKRRWGEYATGQRGKGFIGRRVSDLAVGSRAISDPGIGFRGLSSREGWDAARNKLAEHHTMEALRNNSLAWTADDAAHAAIHDETTGGSREKYLDNYVKHAKERGAKEPDHVLREKGAAALNDIEQGVGAALGTRQLQLASFKSLQYSKTGYDDSKDGLQARIDDTKSAVKRGLMTVNEAAGWQKQSQRAEASQASYSDWIKAIEGGYYDSTGAWQSLNGQTGVDYILDSANEYMTPGAIVTARKESMELLAGRLQETIGEAHTKFVSTSAAAAAPGATTAQKEAAAKASEQFAALMGTYSGVRDTINSHAQHLAGTFAELSDMDLGEIEVPVEVPPAFGQGPPTIKMVKQKLTVRRFEEALKYGQQGIIGGDAQALINDFLNRRREWSATDIASSGGAPPAPPTTSPAAGLGGGGPAAGGPPAGGPPSDMRLKKHITHLETLSSGINLYGFEYVWGGPTYVGVMAQELLETHPEAVGVDANGYYFVDYSMLGIKMMTLREWQQTHELLRS